MDYEKIDELILAGAIEVVGLDAKSGEFLYSFTPKLPLVDPELAIAVEKAFNDDIMLLWEMGFLDVDPLHDSPIVSLNEQSFNNDMIQKLPEHLQTTLLNVVRSLT